MKADVHPRQAERLTALRSYNVLDTGPEADFDDIVRIAVEICDKKYAVVNLIDAERQFFKAEIGFGVRELPLDDSICSHIILGQDFTIIRDTLADPRLRDNPLCIGGPNLRFYAGAPLASDNGLPIGTLCVLDDEPGDLDQGQQRALTALARQVMTTLDLRRALGRADVLRREVDHRIKNSLQSVASLTRIQAKRVVGEEARDALEEVSRRIGTVAALNAQLYQSGPDQTVSLHRFMASVTDLIAASAPENVTLEADFEDVEIGARAASAVALTVNEFATNSFKHAFPGDRAGHISIVGRRVAPGAFRVECRDDGVGMPPEPAPDGLGMTIIAGAAEQLDGVLTTEQPGPGHAIAIEFPV